MSPYVRWPWPTSVPTCAACLRSKEASSTGGVPPWARRPANLSWRGCSTVKVVAAVEAKAQHDRDLAVLAALEQLEFGHPVPEGVRPGGVNLVDAHGDSSFPLENADDAAQG